jgi:alpha-beta hydrolase superfamily lysophospholipase
MSGFFVVRALTSRADPRVPEPLPAITEPVEELRLETRDGEEIGAWLVQGRSDLPAVVLLHGNGGRRSFVMARALPLIQRGYTVLIPTLRAHGDSSGTVNDFGYSARHDVAASVHLLGERDGDQAIVLYGFSLGSAAAIFAAEEVCDSVDGYVLESPYRDLGSASLNRIRRFLVPPFDTIAWWALRAAAPVLIDSESIRPVDAICSIPRGVPVLILAGDADVAAPPEEAGALFEQLGPAARLVVIPDGTHDRLRQTAPELYWREVDTFLAAVQDAHSSDDR